MRLEKSKILSEPRLSQAWGMYSSAFAPLRAAAVQRQVMNMAEFSQVMTDERVAKHLAVAGDDDGKIVALATFTNELDAMPLISPEFFAQRWPHLYARQRIWYLGFFVIDPEHRRSGIFEAVIAQMWTEVQAAGGVAALDVCGQNTALGLPRAIERTLRRLSPGMVAESLDTQTYWAFSLDAMP
jgi:GNAT superfamily N-acetyltransferase